MFIVKLEAEVYARSGLIVELKAKEAAGFVIIEAAEEAGSTVMAEEEAEEEAESALPSTRQRPVPAVRRGGRRRPRWRR